MVSKRFLRNILKFNLKNMAPKEKRKGHGQTDIYMKKMINLYSFYVRATHGVDKISI